jgi:hypothetical protein
MAHVATVTIDSDQVPADATNFPAYINLAHLFAGSASFASTVANGGGGYSRIPRRDGTGA